MSVNRVFSQFILACVLGLLWQPFAMAYKFSAVIEDGELTWKNVTEVTVELDTVPNSTFARVHRSDVKYIPLRFPLTEIIFLGGIQTAQEPSIILHSESGSKNSIEVPFAINGMKYSVVDGVVSSLEYGDRFSANISKEVGAGGNISQLYVVGRGFAKRRYNYVTNENHVGAVSPVYDIRALANINEQGWIDAAKNAPAGIYTLRYIVPVEHLYQNPANHDFYYRLDVPIEVSLEVIKNQTIDSISAVGDGIMTLSGTENSNGMISGETTYKLQATGNFTDRLLIGLVPTKKNVGLYSLSTDEAGYPEIPFSVVCTNGCLEDSVIINEGEAQIDNNSKFVTWQTTPGSEMQEADIKVSFKDIIHQNFAHNENDLTYTGHFVLMFQFPV